MDFFYELLDDEVSMINNVRRYILFLLIFIVEECKNVQLTLYYNIIILSL